jgi:signal transduction histidine kinase
VQEALNNVGKHARAERVQLRVAESDATIEIEVADDGTGFDPRGTRGGFGLLGMRERLAMAGGRLDVASTPGEGTTLRATLPTQEAEGEGAQEPRGG